jgi:CheY-like chemotaxis protein
VGSTSAALAPPRQLICNEATQILLRAKGYDVSVAADGKSGIEAVQRGAFDLAIVDLFMPDMDGRKVIETIRPINPAMPMIAASGFMFGGRCPEMPEFEHMAADAGAVYTFVQTIPAARGAVDRRAGAREFRGGDLSRSRRRRGDRRRAEEACAGRRPHNPR